MATSSSARDAVERGATAEGGARVVVDIFERPRLDEVDVDGLVPTSQAADRVGGIVELRVLAEPVRAVDLDPVVDVGRRQDSEVPVEQVRHASHVVRQRLVVGAVIGDVVAEWKIAECGDEAPDPEIQLVGDPHVEERHADLEAVAAEAHLHASPRRAC